MAIGLSDLNTKKNARTRAKKVVESSPISAGINQENASQYRPWSEHIGDDHRPQFETPAPSSLPLEEKPAQLSGQSSYMARAERAVQKAQNIVSKNEEMIESIRERRIVKDFSRRRPEEKWTEESGQYIWPGDFRLQDIEQRRDSSSLVDKVKQFLLN